MHLRDLLSLLLRYATATSRLAVQETISSVPAPVHSAGDSQKTRRPKSLRRVRGQLHRTDKERDCQRGAGTFSVKSSGLFLATLRRPTCSQNDRDPRRGTFADCAGKRQGRNRLGRAYRKFCSRGNTSRYRGLSIPHPVSNANGRADRKAVTKILDALKRNEIVHNLRTI